MSDYYAKRVVDYDDYDYAFDYREFKYETIELGCPFFIENHFSTFSSRYKILRNKIVDQKITILFSNEYPSLSYFWTLCTALNMTTSDYMNGWRF